MPFARGMPSLRSGYPGHASLPSLGCRCGTAPGEAVGRPRQGTALHGASASSASGAAESSSPRLLSPPRLGLGMDAEKGGPEMVREREGEIEFAHISPSPMVSCKGYRASKRRSMITAG